MAYAWVAFYEDNQFAREVARGRPPLELTAGGRPLRLTSLQLHDHSGAAFIEQLFDAGRRPVIAALGVPSPGRAGTVPCHVLGWQETVRDEAGRPRDVRHLAHVVEDGRVILSPHPLREDVFRRPRRLHPRTRPHTWAAVYGGVHAAPALYQVDPVTGAEASGEHIDRGRLAALVLTDGNGDPRVEQIYARGQRLIYRRRVAQPAGRPDPVVVSLLGWQWPAGAGAADHCQHVTYVFAQSGAVVMAGAFVAGHPYFYGTEPVPADARVVGGGPG